MEKEFVPYNESLELKQLGFDEPCFGFYTYKGEIRRYTNFDGELNDFQSLKNSSITMGDGWVTSPTFSQAFRWFREKCGIDYEIPYAGKRGEYHAFVKSFIYGDNSSSPSIFSYEEAELTCLRKLIEICKTKN